MLTGVLEDNVLCAICFSNAAPKLAIRLDRNHFSTRAYKRIAEAALNYIRTYHEPPRSHIRDLLEDRLDKGEDGRLMSRTITAMEQLAPELNVAFVIDQLDRFVNLRRLNDSLIKAAENCDRGELEKAYEVLYKSAPRSGRSGTGIWLANPDQALRFLEQKESDYFGTGIEALDLAGIRPERKQLLLLIAPTGMGKSWFLIECGKQGILHHKKVLHISLEMTEDQVSQRYVQSILSMTEDQVDSLEINHILKSETGEFLNFTKKQISPEHLAPENRVHLTNLLRFLERRPPFRIEAYPSGTLTVSHLDMQLDLLEQEYDFRPDLVLIDYPRIMAQDADNLRISLGQTMVDLRGQAQARDYALVAVAQSNRQASTAKIIHGNMVAEDYSLMMTADKALTYMRTEEEALQNRARVFVEKGRTRRDKFTVAVTQNYEIGQFCLDSVRFPAKAEKELERIKQEEAAHQ